MEHPLSVGFMSPAPSPPALSESDRIQRLRKVEAALEQMADHCRNLCEQVGTIAPPAENEKTPLWTLLEKDAALSQKILTLIGALLTQEKRLAALLPATHAEDSEQEELIDWPMLESYFTRRSHDPQPDDFA